MKMETRAAFKLRVEKPPPKKKTISCLWPHPSQSPPAELLTLAEYGYKLGGQVSFLAGDTLLTGPPVLIPPPSGGGADLAGASLGL
jgi:hypothetical protein